MRAAKQQDVATRLQKRLDGVEHPDLYPYRSHADQIKRFVQLRPSQQFLDTCGFNLCRRQAKLTRGLTEEGRLPDLGLDHREMEVG